MEVKNRNSICLSGKLRDALDEKFRVLEYELPYFEEPKSGEAKIICKYWNNQENTRLHAIATNTRVIIHGHLDGHEKFGTILVVEQIETMHQ